MGDDISDEQADALAKKFHEHYEELASYHGYKTREESAKPWEDVPEQNKALMRHVMNKMFWSDGQGFIMVRPFQ